MTSSDPLVYSHIIQVDRLPGQPTRVLGVAFLFAWERTVIRGGRFRGKAADLKKIERTPVLLWFDLSGNPEPTSFELIVEYSGQKPILAYFTRSYAPCPPCEAFERSVVATRSSTAGPPAAPDSWRASAAAVTSLATASRCAFCRAAGPPG